MLSPLPGGCSAVGEGTLCMDGQRSPVPPLSVPAARCALPGARVPGPPLSRLRPFLHVSSLRASAPLCVPLPPPPRLRLPPLRASSPAGRTGSEAGRCAGCRAGGRRAWAEPGAGTGGGGWGGSRGLWASERLLRGLRGGDLGVGERCGAGGGGGDSRVGRLVGDRGGRGRAGGGAWGPNGRGRSLRAAYAGCTAGPLCAHVPT